jgi:cytochrome bd-type quinol oxidase subunit 2
MLMLKIKFIIISSLLALTLMFSLVSGLASAQKSEITQGVNSAAGSGGDPKSINDTISNVINILSSLVGVVAVVMLIVGGFRYITSGGDSNRVASAKNTIIYALIGVVIVALAQIIVQFVLNKAHS